MKINLTDKTLFGNEAAEDELEDVFKSYAVSRQEITHFLDDDRHLVIVRAYKGEGKSALLRLVGIQLRAQNQPPLIINISASAVAPDVDGADQDRWVRGWKTNILKLAAQEIGARISCAFSDDAISLVEEAEANGFKERSFVSTVLDRIKMKAMPLERARETVNNPEQTLKRWMHKGSAVWFVIDDLDQNFENTPNFKIKIASFFTALRQIANLIPEFRFRSAVRPNVWAIVKREHESLSHVEQYIIDLSWTQNDYYELLGKRVEGYLRRNGKWDEIEKTLQANSEVRNKQLISLIFDDPMPWGYDKNRPPAVILYTLSRHRPRWLIELWKVAASSAAKARRKRINFDDIQGELEAFGKRRIEDTIAEFKSQCPQLEELLVAFMDQTERFSTDDLIKTLQNRVLQAVHPRIIGILGPPSPREVAHFLFQIGFLTARRDFSNGEYEHLAFVDAPSLLDARTNIDQGCSWEIHPVFRQALRLKNVPNRR